MGCRSPHESITEIGAVNRGLVCARALLAILLSCALGAAVGFAEDSGKSIPPQGAVAQPPSPVLARVGEMEITQADVDRYIGHEVDALKQRLYVVRNQALNSMIDSLVINQEAVRQHTDVTQLLQSEIEVRDKLSSDEIEREWINNYESLRPLGEVAGHYQVVLNRESHDRAEALRQYLDRLRSESHVVVSLEPPTIKLRVRPGDNHLGNPNGSRELVVFQDYECPFCRKLEPELEAALRKPNLSNIKVTIKQYPLSMHKGAFDAAVAAECAGQQNRFPAMHDLLISRQEHSLEGLVATAAQARLDPDKFRTCMASGNAKTQVLLDMDEATKNGVEGTPTLFLDGEAVDLSNGANGAQDIGKVLETKLKPQEDNYSRLQSRPAAADEQTRK